MNSYNYLVINTTVESHEVEESPLVFFPTEESARRYVKAHFEGMCAAEAWYLIVPLDKCIAVWAETCASKFTDVGYLDVM